VSIPENEKRFAVLGYPLSHSFSPKIHNPAFEYLKIKASYSKIEIEPEQFETRIRQLKGSDWVGFNVTIPYKQRILPHLDWIDDTAERIGAVNTIKINEKGEWLGFNTDYIGFLEPIKDKLPEIKNCLLIGAGGAAKGIAFGLLKEVPNLEEIYLLNRTIEKAEHLAKQMQSFRKLKALALRNAEYGSEIRPMDLIVNTTSVGMSENRLEIPMDPGGLLKPGGVVYDIIYNPAKTRFLELAENAGYSIVNGWPMLVGQATASFEIWNEVPFPKEVKQKLLDMKM